MPSPETLAFTCNICGAASELPRDAFDRETGHCSGCRATVRWRAVVHVLSLGLFGESLPLPAFPRRPELLGFGLSDWEGYAGGLAAAFNYANTFLEREPRLDIMQRYPRAEGKLDFLVASDVFEHTPPPREAAIENAFRLLKPGGLLVLTVPYGRGDVTAEHFPRYHEARVIELGGRRILVNLTREGDVETFQGLVFHGDSAGGGGALEMRIWAEDDLLATLERAGFTDVQVHREPEPRWGIAWRFEHGLPISARRPAAAG